MRNRHTLAILVGVALVYAATLTRLLSAGSVDVVTFHNDSGRTGQNLAETILSPLTVNATLFGKKALITLDGNVDAQPLFLSALPIPGQGTRNVLFAATEHGSVYGIDADSWAAIWRVSMFASGETPSDARGCSQVTRRLASPRRR
jgi:hypothetical protein